MSGALIIDYIADSLSRDLRKHLEHTNFFSILTDGSTDASIIEKEAIFVITFDPSPAGSDKIGIKITFLELADLSNADASGVLKSIKTSFEKLGIDDMRKLVGFGSDGASVNAGKKQGVKTLLQADNPWLVFGWCVAHRLELALKDALAGTVFADVDELILRMYYLYKRSPKKLRQLKELVDIYEDSFEFVEGGFKPKKASGTRWIGHKTRALDVIVDKYGIFMQHLENLTEDKSYPSKERAKFKGWHQKWTNARIPLLACLSIEVLAPARILSKIFQAEEVDVVAVGHNLQKTKQQLDRIERKDFDQLPTVQRFLNNVEEDEGEFKYQDVVLKNFLNGKESAQRRKNEWTSLVSKAIENRLEPGNSEISKYSSEIINTEGWFRSTEDPDFLDNELEELYNHFEIPLKNAGFDGNITEMTEQWHDLVSYAIKYFDIQKTDYRVIWRKIFDSSRNNGWKLVLLLVKLLFTLPISNAKVERLFSLMNRVKTDTRNSLSQSRLSGLLRICMEGPSLKEFDPVAAMKLWNEKARRPDQPKRKAYKPRAQKAHPGTLIELESSESAATESDEES